MKNGVGGTGRGWYNKDTIIHFIAIFYEPRLHTICAKLSEIIIMKETMCIFEVANMTMKTLVL